MSSHFLAVKSKGFFSPDEVSHDPSYEMQSWSLYTAFQNPKTVSVHLKSK